MLGGEREAPPMIRAQRDMVKLEKKYYEERVINLAFFLAFALLAGGICFGFYKIAHQG
jgi:hypothetical protein